MKFLTSQYVGVFWHNVYKKWIAGFQYKKKKYYGGLYDNEVDAAKKVNSICDELGIQKKNHGVI